MGDAVPAEGYEEGPVESEDLHPPTLEQNNPWFLSQVVFFVTSFVAQNGWLCVGLAVAGYYLWTKFQPKVQELKARRERDNEAAEYHKDPDKFMAKERAIAAARQRIQEDYNRKSDRNLEEVKIREEEKRLKKLEETAHLPAGRRINETNNSAASNTATKKNDTGKAKLRPEYNPLMSDYSNASSGYRPSRRTGGG